MVIVTAWIALSWSSVAALLGLLLALERQLGQAPRLAASAPQGWPDTIQAMRVVIPVYNEQENIVSCLEALSAALPPDAPVQVLVADDGSTDMTVALAQSLCDQICGARVISVGPRPEHERWCGKNWPASIAAAQPWAEGDPAHQWILFLDADVRLRPGALAAAKPLQAMITI